MSGKKGRLAWTLALAVLAGALVYFNLSGPSRPAAAAQTAQYASDAPLGYRVGEQLPDFTLEQTNGETFTLSAQRGRVVVINLWATWCTPCVNELPYFDRLQRENPDGLRVLAIHSDLITDDVDAYLARFDYGIDFAVDTTGEVIAAVGGSTMLPQTLVLNARGEVVYNQVGSVTYEALAELAQAAGE